MSDKELATLILRVLDAQAQYFKTRDREDLIKSKLLEGKLRHRAKDILDTQMKLGDNDGF